MGLAERIYAALLHAFPAPFHEEFGAEMRFCFRETRKENPWAAWGHAFADVAGGAPREHAAMAWHDIRTALRGFVRRPGYPLAITAFLALGIAASGAVLALAHAVLLRPLPYPEPDRLLRVYEQNERRNFTRFSASVPNYLDWRERSRTLDLAAFSHMSLNWSREVNAERLTGLALTASAPRVLGLGLASGRWFDDEEERRGRHRVAVLSHEFWMARFGGLPVLGRTMQLNGGAYTIVGVAAEGVRMPDPADVFVPKVVEAEARGNHYISVIGRIRPGFSEGRAREEMERIARDLEREHPESNREWGVFIETFRDWIVPAPVRGAMKTLALAVLAVLAILCANIAGLQLARAAVHARDAAVRRALGAGGRRLTRAMITESLLLALAGGAAGVAGARALLAASRPWLTDWLPRTAEIALDPTAVMGMLGIATLCGVIFGLVPARAALRANLTPALQWGNRSTGGARAGARAVLTGCQAAVATALLIGAGLLLRSSLNLSATPRGFDADSVLTAQLALPSARYRSPGAMRAFQARLLDELSRAPGVAAAGLTTGIPFGPGRTAMGAAPLGESLQPTGEQVACEWRLAAAGYFRALRIPILRGRTFLPADESATRPVAIVSESMARAFFGAADPIGRRIAINNGAVAEIVGVAGDVRMRKLNEPPERVMYIPSFAFDFWPVWNVVVRAKGEPESAIPALRAALRRVDAALPAYDVHPMSYWVDRSVAETRLLTSLLGGFAAAAMLLAAFGLFGVVSYLAAARRSEFGIRIALGARPAEVARMMMRQSLAWPLAGVLAGALGAWGLTPALTQFLYGITARDGTTFLAVPLALIAVAAVAALIPAYRAASADPSVTLRA